MHVRVWNHGANSARKIAQTFSSQSVYNSIEVDISSINGTIRLAHGPEIKKADTSLDAFLDTIKTITTAYTIKFDFKDEFSIRNGIPRIKKAQLDTLATRHALIASADTLVGPGGTRHLIMNSTDFIGLVRQELPLFLVSIGMTTGWNVRTLFFLHAYTAHHIDQLAQISNCTLCLHMVILSQTNPTVLDRISHADLLVWGERGLFETMWLRSHPQFSIDQDLGQVGVWLVATYTWLILCTLLSTCLLFHVVTRFTHMKRSTISLFLNPHAYFGIPDLDCGSKLTSEIAAHKVV